MKIAIFGTGMVGQALGAKLLELRHQVVFGTRDVKTTLARKDSDIYGNPPFSEWIKDHQDAQIGTFNDAAAAAELLINATSGSASLAVLNLASANFMKEKILIDVANPLDFSKGFPPSLSVCNTNSLAEQLQSAFPKTRVVKTLNTLNASLMTNPGLLPGDHSLFLSGNDADAKSQVSGFLSNWFGWKQENILDLGGIETARGTEMILPLWITLLGQLGHPNFNWYVNVGNQPG